MVGMLCGNTVSGVVVAVAYVLKELWYVTMRSILSLTMMTTAS